MWVALAVTTGQCPVRYLFSFLSHFNSKFKSCHCIPPLLWAIIIAHIFEVSSFPVYPFHNYISWLMSSESNQLSSVILQKLKNYTVSFKINKSQFITYKWCILPRGLGSRNSVCLSVKRVVCDKTKQCTAHILITHKWAITLVFWHQQWLVCDASFRLKFALSDPPPLKNALPP